jgi:hypothetical protein
MYKRRFDRLNFVLTSDEPVLFVRMANHTPMNDNWKGRFKSCPDDIPRWFDIILYLEKHFKKPIHLLIVTMDQVEYDEYKDKLPSTGRFHLRMYDDRNVNGNDENIQAVSKILYKVYEEVRDGSNV